MPAIGTRRWKSQVSESDGIVVPSSRELLDDWLAVLTLIGDPEQTRTASGTCLLVPAGHPVSSSMSKLCLPIACEQVRWPFGVCSGSPIQGQYREPVVSSSREDGDQMPFRFAHL